MCKTCKDLVMTDYDIFKWLYAHVVFIERLKSGKFAITYSNLSGDDVIVIGEDIKDCVRKANNV